jgi:hypothetical protein
MPLASQAPSTNVVDVRVTDNGIPPLSADQVFSITVGLPPSLGVATVGANLFALTWPSFPGNSYQVEFTDDLATGIWSPLNGSLPGTGDWLSVTNVPATPAQRFYRLSVAR